MTSDSMLTLYHCENSRSLRCLWTFKELRLRPDVDYKLVVMPFPPRQLYKPYLKVNPLGTVPFLTDGKVRMTESCAIPQYVVHRCGGPQSALAVRPEEPDYADC